MMRLLPGIIVAAYEATGRIPIRMAWTTKDERGGCAIDTLAEARGVTTEDLRAELDDQYEVGFLTAWDADNPRSFEIQEMVEDESAALKLGYCDGVVCRREVERMWSSALIPVETDPGTTQS